MNSLFEAFSKLVDSVPAGAVRRTIEAEGVMLKKDLADLRLSSPIEERDAKSILAFDGFVSHEWSSEPMCQVVPPLEHLAYYRRVVDRLVDAGYLPYQAKEAFDRTFSNVFLKELNTL